MDELITTGGMIMKKIISLVLILVLLGGCAYVKTIEVEFEEAGDGHIVVECSDEIVRGKKAVNDLAYYCEVNVSDQTTYINSSGESLTLESFLNEVEMGSELKIELEKRQYIKKTQEVDAKRIIMLD